MKREALLIVGVLVPFSVLVWLGLRFTSSESVARVGEVRTMEGPVVRVVPIRAIDAGVALDASVAVAPVAARHPLAAVLAAVKPEVDRCFDDQRTHLAGSRTIEVRFTPTRDGGFSNVVVGSVQNPYLTACVEDVFDEVPWIPAGDEAFEPASLTFSAETR